MDQEAAAVPGAIEETMCPLPGQPNTEDCKGADIKGCMDEAGLNYNPQATLATECCYPPNRYVKVDMSESIFRENFWTMSVDGAVTGASRVLVDGKVHTVVDAGNDFQCSKKTQF